jgi:hypothetical protein
MRAAAQPSLRNQYRAPVALDYFYNQPAVASNQISRFSEGRSRMPAQTYEK